MFIRRWKKMLKTILEACLTMVGKIKSQSAEIATLKTERDEAVELAKNLEAELKAITDQFTPSGN